MMTTQIPRTVTCPISGFETLSITYDMMARARDVERISAAMNGDIDRSAMIIDIHGWPEAEYPGGPFGEDVPMAVLLWVIRLGFGRAVSDWVNDPNSMTG